MPASSHTIDRVAVTFDDERAVANAGLLVPATLASRLGVEQVVDDSVDLGDRPGAPRPGRKALTVALGMLAGARCIDDLDVLRAGATGRLFDFDVAAPSTVGSWLRAFTFGHVRQLDRALDVLLVRAWQAGAGPGDRPLVIDLDSTICPVFGYAKHGAAYGYTRIRGYHPLLATRADTGEVLHIRLRNGSANTQRGAKRFVEELIARVRRAGATGPIVLRADSGFWSKAIMAICRRLEVRYQITVRQQPFIRDTIEAIDETAWQPINYPSGIAQVAETHWGNDRLIVRRVRNENEELRLFELWRYHAFVTNQDGTAVELDADHRAHAKVELVIRDLKDNGLARLPSGKFFANAAWCVLAALAHNLTRWALTLGGLARPATGKTLRGRLWALPGRLTRSARRWTLHLPARWPWQADLIHALTRIRALTPAAA